MQGSASLQQERPDDCCHVLWYGWMDGRMDGRMDGWCHPGCLCCMFSIEQHITQLCARAPSLIHSWSLCSDEQQFYDRQHLVQYMMQSEVGYYVSGVRITSQLTVKITYVLCVVFF